jgi:hypothetical protein
MVQDTVKVFEDAMPMLRSSPISARQEVQKEAA